MGIEGITPSPNPFSRIDKSDVKPKTQAGEPVKEAPKAHQADAKAGPTPTPSAAAQQRGDQSKVEGALPPISQGHEKTEAAPSQPDKAAHHIAELQAMAEKIKQSTEQSQTRHEIMSMGNSLIEMQHDLTSAHAKRYAENLQAEETYTQLSYWDKLDVVSKSQTINKIKEEINDVTIDRAHLVNQLKEQIASGDYRPSGAAILKGMLNEFF